jgi:hypothetical protein
MQESFKTAPCIHRTILKQNKRPIEKETQYMGEHSFEDWQVEFIQMPMTTGNFKNLLVLVDIFSG